MLPAGLADPPGRADACSLVALGWLEAFASECPVTAVNGRLAAAGLLQGAGKHGGTGSTQPVHMSHAGIHTGEYLSVQECGMLWGTYGEHLPVHTQSSEACCEPLLVPYNSALPLWLP